ncbi:MAG: hypothetical protein H0Z24_00555 [Thermosipho sp. (in: Bacteria)]|nr:hypothetical protein [Thermosipho sp. (in: thermotogales)]
MGLFVNLLIGFVFLQVFFDFNNIIISLIVAFLAWAILYPGKFNFSLLVFDALKKIPRVIFEGIIILFSKRELVESEKYKDNFEILRKIINITLTPKTIVFEHDDDFIYIHKLDRE